MRFSPSAAVILAGSALTGSTLTTSILDETITPVWAAETGAPAAPAIRPAPSTEAGPNAAASKDDKSAPKDKAIHDSELSADMAVALRKAGFTDLQIMPNSLFVRGKDKAGNPVAMVLNTGSMTEMVMLDPHVGTAAAGNGGMPPLTGSGTFTTALPTQKLGSALIGVTVANETGGKIGTIKDLVIDHGGVHAYVVGVGGLFGIGDRYVAVTPSALSLVYDNTAKSYRATMSATVDQLKAAPEFRFEDLAEAKKD